MTIDCEGHIFRIFLIHGTRIPISIDEDETRGQRKIHLMIKFIGQLARGRICKACIWKIKIFLERILETPASAGFIDRFRQDQLSMPTLCDAAMLREDIVCTVYLEQIQFNQSYATWPCASQPPQRFHSRFMLELLRRKNLCPLCRHSVETSSVSSRHPCLPEFFPR
jgi:hypothetical protein